MSERLGPADMLKIIQGRYFKPRKEQRIFMFLDLKSSTGIAENLGHDLFHQFINDWFHDIADVILRLQGHIIEYVGDEVVISWALRTDQEKDNSYRCFFELDKYIGSRKEYYQTRYGFYPEFKAGIHCGEVTIGEVGRVKKSIAYRGEVLHTTSHLENLCKSHNSRLTASEDFVQLFSSITYPHELIGKMVLRGKSSAINIYRLA